MPVTADSPRQSVIRSSWKTCKLSEWRSILMVIVRAALDLFFISRGVGTPFGHYYSIVV
jgi:hypothetical protein